MVIQADSSRRENPAMKPALTSASSLSPRSALAGFFFVASPSSGVAFFLPQREVFPCAASSGVADLKRSFEGSKQRWSEKLAKISQGACEFVESCECDTNEPVRLL